MRPPINWMFFATSMGERFARLSAQPGWTFGMACVAALLAASVSQAEPDAEVRSRIVGDAVLEEGAYRLLKTLSDEIGPRMIGTEGHRRSMDHLEGELRALGLETRRQCFEFPGWRRGEAEVRILEPVQRTLRAVELGYVGTSSDVEGCIEYLDTVDLDALESKDLQGKILLLKPNLTFVHEELLALSERGVVAADEPFLLGVAYERELASARETIQSTIAEIQSELPAEGPLADSGGTGGTLFSDIRERLETAQAEIAQVVASALPPDQVQKLAFYDSDFLSLDPLGEAHFFTRLGRYTALLDAFNAGRAEHSPVGRLAERVQAYEQASAAGLIEREAYRGPREQSVDTASRKLSELFRAQYFQRLAADYRSGLTSLVEGLRFPLVLPVTNDSLSPEQVEEVGALLDAVDKELQGPALELFAPADQRSLGDFRARLRPVIALGRSLAAGQAGTARVEVSLPGQQLQNDVLQQLVDGADIAHINFKWEEVRLNNDASVRTRRPTGELLGKVSLAAPELNLRFYRLSQEDPDPLRFSGNWAPLQWLLSSKVSPGPGGQDFNVLVQRTDDGITYSMVVSLDFPGPLPAAEDWPKAADLLRRN